jgi:hypothetical protein
VSDGSRLDHLMRARDDALCESGRSASDNYTSDVTLFVCHSRFLMYIALGGLLQLALSIGQRRRCI